MVVQWRIHLQSPPSAVYRLLSTDDGRAQFWAEEAAEWDGYIEFRFPGGQLWRGRILAEEPPHRFSIEYYGGTTTTFTLQDDGRGGTDLLLTDEGIAAEDYAEVHVGWVSVLLALKAAVDFGVDLRNHDSARTWDQGYADN